MVSFTGQKKRNLLDFYEKLICNTLLCLFYKKEKVWMIMIPGRPLWLEVLQLIVESTTLRGSAAVTTSTCQSNRVLERGNLKVMRFPREEEKEAQIRGPIESAWNKDFNRKSGNGGQRDRSVPLWYPQLSVTRWPPLGFRNYKL